MRLSDRERLDREHGSSRRWKHRSFFTDTAARDLCGCKCPGFAGTTVFPRRFYIHKFCRGIRRRSVRALKVIYCGNLNIRYRYTSRVLAHRFMCAVAYSDINFSNGARKIAEDVNFPRKPKCKPLRIPSIKVLLLRACYVER